MSIIVKLDDMLYERRMTLTELSERIGITLANLSVLKTGKARAIRFSTLDAICAASPADAGKAAAALGHVNLRDSTSIINPRETDIVSTP
jgi:putative transcriptional regulator